jgi:hypothetical protein
MDRVGESPVTGMPAIGLAPRRKRRRRNPVLMVLGIVGGGILGLVIGYAILMFAFDPPKDPLRIAPTLPGFMVPKALRSDSEERVASFPTDDKSGDKSADNATASDPASEEGAKSQQNNEPFLPSQPFDAPATDPGQSNLKSIPDPSANPLDAATTQTNRTQSAAAEGKDPLADLFGDSSTTAAKPDADVPVVNPIDAAATNEKTTPQPWVTKSAADPTEKLPADPIETLGPVTDKSFTYKDVLSAIAAARLTTQRALDLPLDAPAAQRKKVNGPFYMNLCRVAEAVTFVERSAVSELDDKATTAAIETILNAAPEPRRLEELGKLAGYWYERPQGNGIVLASVVKQSNARGKLVESTVELLGTNPVRAITVVSPAALTDEAGQPVLIAGTIVKDAGKNLRGYEGTAGTVVWAAIAIDPRERTAAR